MAGLSVDGRARLLAALSVVGIALAVAAAWIVLRRIGLPEWRWVVLLVAVSGPTLAYGNTTWGEMLATGLVTLLVALALLPARPALVGLAAFGAGLTKETGYVFVAALGLLALLLASRRAMVPIRRHVLFGAAGLALAVAVGSGLNLIRYGTPRNAYYLDPGLRTTTVEKTLELAAGLFVAPNGGILLFWPLATLVLGLLLALPLVRASRGAVPWRDAWPAAALLVIVGGLTAVLAVWWSPFGWWAWGPRLSLPWVLPILLLALAAFGSSLTPLVARVLGPIPGLVAVAALAVATALPHVGLLWRPETVGEFFFFTKTAVCPGGGPPPTPEYYACLREEMWTRHPILLDALGGLATPGGAITTIFVALVVYGLSRAPSRRNASACLSDRDSERPLLLFRHPQDVVARELPDELGVRLPHVLLDLRHEVLVRLRLDDLAALAVDDLAHRSPPSSGLQPGLTGWWSNGLSMTLGKPWRRRASTCAGGSSSGSTGSGPTALCPGGRVACCSPTSRSRARGRRRARS